MPDWARRSLVRLKEHLGRPSPDPSSKVTRPKPPASGAVSPPPNQLSQSNSQPLHEPEIISSLSDFPQRLELHCCWKEAFEKLQEEHGSLLNVYEKLLLTNVDDKETQGGPAGSSNTLPRLQSLVQARLDKLQKSKFKINVAGKEIVIREQVGRAINAILSVKDLITTAEPHSAVAWAGVLLILNPIAKSITRDEDAMTAFEEITIMLVRYRLIENTNFEIYSQNVGANVSQTPPQELRASIRTETVKLYTKILTFQIRLAHHFSNSGFFRFFDDLGPSDDWNTLLQAITVSDNRIKDHLNQLSQDTMREIYLKVDQISTKFLDLVSQTLDEVKETKQTQLLNSMPVATGAAFNSYEDQEKPPCLEGTQMSTLKRIQEWHESPEGQRVYWLKGMAGTGKSTISRTVAEAFDKRLSLVDGSSSSFLERTCLAGSFFFDQGKADRKNASKLVPTICRQLATALPDTKHEICKALSKDQNICNQRMKEQWDHLILQPLLALERQIFIPLTLVIVIDALDECEGQNINGLIARFTEPWNLSTIQLKFFITSRPEAHILSAFRTLEHPCEVYDDDLEKVHFVSEPNKLDDITRFVTLTMTATCKSHNFPDGWPGKENIDKLASNSDGLWIFAATTCRFFQEDRLTIIRAEKRLDVVLNQGFTDESPQSNLDAMYRRILRYSVLSHVPKDEIDLVSGPFKRIVGSMVVLFDPLPKAALRELLSLGEFQLNDALQGLYSVLSIEKDPSSPVRFLHLSFREFLLDPERCQDENLHICARTAHIEALRACLQILSDKLKENYFGIPHPSEGSEGIDCFQAPLAVKYASLYWVDHLKHSAVEFNDVLVEKVYDFLKSHFLHWIELLSAIQKMPEAVSAVLKLKEIFAGSTAKRTELQSFLQDARRFILHFRGIIEAAPLQIYRSALVYSPESSIIRTWFREHIPKSYTTLPKVEAEWSPLIQSLEDPSHPEDIAFSPDGKLIASSSARVWDVATGTLLHDFQHSGQCKTVAFSGDGKSLLALSSVGDLLVWDLDKDKLQAKVKSSLTGSPCEIHIFSHGRALAACASEQEVELFDLTKVEALRLFNESVSSISALCFSSDDTLLASGSENGTIWIWDRRTQRTKMFEAYTDECRSCSRVAFSKDNKVVAVSTIFGGLITIDLATGTLLNKLDMRHEADIVFLPDFKSLLSVGDNIQTWDFTLGTPLRTINAYCKRLRLSPDARLILSGPLWQKMDNVSGSYVPSGGIHLWDTKTSSLLGVFGVAGINWSQAVFSPDSSMFAVIVDDKTVQLWDLMLQSKSEPQVLETCGQSSQRIVSSPTTKEAAFNMSKNIHLWDVKTRRLRSVVEHSYKFRFWAPSSLKYDSYISWSSVPDSSTKTRRFATEYHRNTLFSIDGQLTLTYDLQQAELWETQNGRFVWGMSHHLQSAGQWAFSPDGNLLSHIYKVRYRYGDDVPCEDWKNVIQIDTDCPDEPPIITIWELRTNTVLHTTNGFHTSFLDLTFSPDSTMFACIRKDAGLHSEVESTVLEIWVTAGFRCIVRSAPVDIVPPLVWSPDGTTIGCFSTFGSFQLFGSDSLTLQRSFGHFGDHFAEMPEKKFLGLTFSPDGNVLASVNFNEPFPHPNSITISVWDLGSQRLMGSFQIPPLPERHSSVCFSEDSKAVYTDIGRRSIESLSSGSRSQEDLFVDGCWIVCGKHEAVWLPRDYRAARAAAVGNTLIMSHRCCHVTFFGFEEGV